MYYFLQFLAIKGLNFSGICNCKFNLGFGSLIWITVAELLPLRVRSVTNSLSVGFTCLCSFFTAHTYNGLLALMGGEGVFWLYGGFSLAGFFFILLLVPETKDKSEAEIQEFFLSGAQKREARERRERQRSQSD